MSIIARCPQGESSEKRLQKKDVVIVLARLRKESGMAVVAWSTLEERLGGLWLHNSERG